MKWWYEPEEEEMRIMDYDKETGKWYYRPVKECENPMKPNGKAKVWVDEALDWEKKVYKNPSLCIGCKNAFFSKPHDHRDPTPRQLGYCIKCDNCLIKEKKMEFDKTRVYTALNADELRAGDKVIVANTMAELKRIITGEIYCIAHIMRVNDEDCENRFCIGESNATGDITYPLAYLVERAENCTNCEGCEYKDKEWMKKNKDYLINRCENYKPNLNVCGDNRFEIIARARKHIIEATNIEHSPDEMKVLDNFLFRCWQMGWLDRVEVEHREPKTEQKAEPKTEKEDNVWDYESLPERQENGVSDHVIVAVEGCPYGQSGYYDYDMQAWFVDGCSEPVKVEAWQKIELPKKEMCLNCKHYNKVNDFRDCTLINNPTGACPHYEAEKHYRPFKDTDELIDTWLVKSGMKKEDGFIYGLSLLGMPLIWVRRKEANSKGQLITEFGDGWGVGIGRGEAYNMTDLWMHFTFLDGSVCGVEE